MLINKNYLITFAIFFIAILTGKEILIYNEETLIVLTFSSFVILAYINLGDGIANDLNDRAEKIQKEFEAYFDVREETLNTLISYHEKQLTLAEEIIAIANFSKTQIAYIIDRKEASLEGTIDQQIKNKLKAIVSEESRVIQEMQRTVLAEIQDDFANEFVVSNTAVQEAAIEDALEDLDDIIAELGSN